MARIVKKRTKPFELLVLKILSYRMKLSEAEKSHLISIDKGYAGELVFDSYTDQLISDHWQTMGDLFLEFNQTPFQVDSLVRNNEKLYLFDVKNFEGDYFIDKDGRWFSKLSGNEIRDPLEQLKRCESLLRRQLHYLGYHLPIEAYLVFVNPEFHLFNASMNLPIIYPTQLNRFIKNANSSRGPLKDRYPDLFQRLLSLNKPYVNHDRLPTYTFESLYKGNFCIGCHQLLTEYVGELFVCKCGQTEEVTSVILRSIDEYRLLFPNKNITTNDVFEWCGKIKSTKAIRRILHLKYSSVGYGRHVYYIER
jgi:hypothetical protein